MAWPSLFSRKRPEQSSPPRPPSFLGAELFWWRQAETLNTRITFRFPDLGVTDRFTLRFQLFNADGDRQADWESPVAQGQPVALDASRIEKERGFRVEDGVLSIATHADAGNGQPSPDARRRFQRLFGYIDWLSEESEVAGLHSDQVVTSRTSSLELTEVVLTDAATVRHALVYLNSGDEQPKGSIHFRAEALGRPSCEATLRHPLKANRANQLWLDEVFGAAWKKLGDGPILLSGRIEEPRHYTRPYVLSAGKRMSAYHGGDRYSMTPQHHFQYKILGEGEVNPALVVENEELGTVVNVLNSHGSLEEDFPVTLRLYDQSGRLVRHEPSFGVARRNGLSRHALADVVPYRPFVGYAAFTFSESGRREYPGHLQALMEYRAKDSVARMMFWSDEWNTAERRRSREAKGVPYQAYGRLLDTDTHEVFWAITNCGDAAYRDEAEAQLEITTVEGWSARASVRLGPHETVFSPLRALVPEAGERLKGATGICLVTSTSDLAMAQFVRHRKSGVWAAEHVMSIIRRAGGGRVVMAGS